MRSARPTGRESIVEWFHEVEKLKGSGLDPQTEQVAPWFHGKNFNSNHFKQWYELRSLGNNYLDFWLPELEHNNVKCVTVLLQHPNLSSQII